MGKGTSSKAPHPKVGFRHPCLTLQLLGPSAAGKKKRRWKLVASETPEGTERRQRADKAGGAQSRGPGSPPRLHAEKEGGRVGAGAGKARRARPGGASGDRGAAGGREGGRGREGESPDESGEEEKGKAWHELQTATARHSPEPRRRLGCGRGRPRTPAGHRSRRADRAQRQQPAGQRRGGDRWGAPTQGTRDGCGWERQEAPQPPEKTAARRGQGSRSPAAVRGWRGGLGPGCAGVTSRRRGGGLGDCACAARLRPPTPSPPQPRRVRVEGWPARCGAVPGWARPGGGFPLGFVFFTFCFEIMRLKKLQN